MECKCCGCVMDEDANFCPICGTKKEDFEMISIDGNVIKGKQFDTFDPLQELVPQTEIITEKKIEKTPYEIEKQKSDGSAILKFAILGLVFGCTAYLSFLGLIFSSIAQSKIRRYIKKYGETDGRATVGKGLNVAGRIVSTVFFAIICLYLGVVLLTAIAGLGSL